MDSSGGPCWKSRPCSNPSSSSRDRKTPHGEIDKIPGPQEVGFLPPSRCSMSRVDLLCLTVCFVLAGPLGADDNWPAFRGPTGDGHSTAKGLPLTWSEKENIRWKTPIPGKAWSSPVIWGKQIWMTNAPEDGKQLQAVCVDRDSGKVIHDLKVFDNP